MTNERIDHAAEARDYVNTVESVAMNQHLATRTLAAAQVHATLALVEQQRIANLIAIHDEEFPPSFLEREEWDAVRTQIREGLGL